LLHLSWSLQFLGHKLLRIHVLKKEATDKNQRQATNVERPQDLTSLNSSPLLGVIYLTTGTHAMKE
jgi:hypothetical protein